jgi:hypothetical protein
MKKKIFYTLFHCTIVGRVGQSTGRRLLPENNLYTVLPVFEVYYSKEYVFVKVLLVRYRTK